MVNESPLSLHFPSLSSTAIPGIHILKCVYFTHVHAHTHTHTHGGNPIQTAAFSTVGRIPRVCREDRIKERETQGERASNLTLADPFTHTCIRRWNTEWLGQLRDSDIIFSCPPQYLIWAERTDWNWNTKMLSGTTSSERKRAGPCFFF